MCGQIYTHNNKLRHKNYPLLDSGYENRSLNGRCLGSLNWKKKGFIRF